MEKYFMEVQFRNSPNDSWQTTYTNSDKARVLELFSEDVVAHYIGKAPYVKSIRRKNLYNGAARYVVDKSTETIKTRVIYDVSIYC